MDDWVEEVNLLLSGAPKRTTKPKPSPIFKSKRASQLLSLTLSPSPSRTTTSRSNSSCLSPPSQPTLVQHPATITPELATQWFKPGRSPPAPHSHTSTSVPSSPSPSTPRNSAVPWRRYMNPIPERPPPPTMPLPARPPASDVPSDVDETNDASPLLHGTAPCTQKPPLPAYFMRPPVIQNLYPSHESPMTSEVPSIGV